MATGVTGVSDSKNLLWMDGQSINLSFTRTTIVIAGSFVTGTIYKITSVGTTDFTLVGASDNIVGLSFSATGPGSGTGTTTTAASGVAGTCGTLTWNIPKNYTTYNGILITSATKDINPSNYPTDSVKYTPSSNLSVIADKIGNAQVIVALYNDVVSTSMDITGLIPNVPYFFSAHAISNVFAYYTLGVQSYAQAETTSMYASDMLKSYGPPLNPTVGQVYFDEDQRLVFVWSGSIWEPTSASNTLSGQFDPLPGQNGLPTGYPTLGDFFYNTTQKKLKCWDGSVWNDAQSTPGTPIYQKMGVGTDLSRGARDKMIDSIKRQFGWPTVCVELDIGAYDVAIDNALQELRHRTDVAYTKQYFFVQIQRFQDTYYLNDPASGTDKIVDVIKIHRLNMLGLVNFAPDNIYAQQFLNQFYAPGVSYDLVSIHLIAAMSETYSMLFAGEVAFNWRESSREMKIYKKFGSQEKVLVEASCEKSEQELLSDRWTSQWLQQWAKSVCNITLANIRGKYTNMPGPGGGISMNADTLMSEGTRLQDDCLRQIQDFEIGQNGPDNFYLPFMIG